MNPSTAELPDRQVLTFQLGEATYALDLLSVNEIRGSGNITAMPRTSPWLLGAMNLRGQVIPIVDARTRLGIDAAAPKRPVIVVLNLSGRLVGLRVDAVSDVVQFRSTELERPPVAEGEAEYVEAVGRLDDRLILILSTARLTS